MKESALWQMIRRHPVAMGLSIAVHLVLLVILGVGLTHTSTPSAPRHTQVKTMEAVVVDANVVKAEAEKLKRADQQKKQQEDARKQQLQNEMEQARERREKEEQRIADLQRKQKESEQAELLLQKKLDKDKKEKQLELEKLEKQKQAEQKRLTEIAEKRKAEEEAEKKRKSDAEAEARRKQDEAELQRRMAEEEQKRAANNSRLQTLRDQYLLQIEQHISRRWIQPAQMSSGWQCEVKVQQNAMGDILSVQMVNCNGSEAFRSSVEQAVNKSSPLPVPRDPDVFDKTIRFTFNPKS
ncbi:MAG: cell envelope integrity protein TolA [Gammaproteobacteria bacterium]|nr:cell envelope integrity protein TolA [Gammaproteobacteria bacterium]